MLKLRPEVASFVRSCERLIFSAAMNDQPKLTEDEAQVVAYYTGQISKITEPSGASAETAATGGHAMQLDIESVLAPLNTPASTIRRP